SRSDPTLLNNSEMAVEGPDDLLVPDLWTMKKLCHPSLNGQGGPIGPIAIQAMNFRLKNDMIQQSIKVNGVTDDALRLYLFPHSLTHHATAWFDRLPRNSINTFEQMAKMFLEKYFPPSMVTNLRNEITNFRQRPNESLFKAWKCYELSIDRCPNHNMLPVTQIDTFYNSLTLRHRDTINAIAGGTFMKRPLKAEMAKINKNLMRVLQVNQQVKAVTPNCETCGGPHSFNDCPATVGNTQNVYDAGSYQGIKETIILKGTTREEANSYRELTKFMKMNTASSLGSGTLSGNTITNPKEDLKGITTRSGTAYQGPTIPTTSFFPIVECETEATKDMVHPTNNGSTKDIQPPVVPTESLILNSEPVTSPVIEPVASLDLNFNINFADAFILMPKFGPSIKSFLTNKDKICELARTPLNEHCLAVLLKKLQEKLGDPGKFLIPCDFPIMAECLALADLDASINLMPLSVWNKLSLPDLYPMCMTLELVDRSISRPVGVAEDVFVKVGTFHFPVDFVVVDFDADPRVPIILGRSFLKTGRALIDVFKGGLTLRVGKEAITFNLNQTSRYPANYNDMTTNRIGVIDMACEEYSQEVLSFFDVITTGNPTPYYDPIVSTTSLTLTPFENSDFLLEEVDAFLALEDDPTSLEVDQSYVYTEGGILLLEAFLNDDPSLPPPNQGNYMPEVHKELKIYEAKSDKSSIDKPPKVELKDLPSHLEYVFLEGDNKLPIIITKYLSIEEKTALITVLKSHNRAIAWKLSDIKGIDPEFYTHKILMEQDFKPAVQHQ
nr:reverse transcriptase domain-containing protein [Tanacetum cinerariifolium]